jgi:hypothetical protein
VKQASIECEDCHELITPALWQQPLAKGFMKKKGISCFDDNKTRKIVTTKKLSLSLAQSCRKIG